MGKVRTQRPYYGKLSQRLDAAANKATKEGDLKAAKLLHDKSRELVEKRRKGLK